MVKVKVKRKISFDGVVKNINEEIEMSKERFEKMIENFKTEKIIENFKTQKLEINNYIEVLKIDAEPTIETPQKAKVTRKRN